MNVNVGKPVVRDLLSLGGLGCFGVSDVLKNQSKSFKASDKQALEQANVHNVRCRQCNHPQRSQAPDDSWRDGLSQRQRDDVC